MPRKSRELRLSQTKSLIEAYADAGIGHADRSFRFMNDMSARLERGKGLSKGQRNYLDNLIDQGVPKPKNEEKVKEILENFNKAPLNRESLIQVLQIQNLANELIT